MKETKSEWPKIVKDRNATVKVYKYPNQFRIVFYDTDGSRKTLSEQDEAKAMRVAAKTASRLSTFGGRVACVQPELVAEYVRLDDLLKPHGVTLRDGAEALNRWLAIHKTLAGIDAALAAQRLNGNDLTQIRPKSVPEAVKDFLAEHRTNGESSEYHIMDLDTRLDRLLVQKFNCEVSTIDTATLQDLLDKANGGAASYEHNRRVLSTFFQWCFCQRYHAENPACTPKDNMKMHGKTYLKKRTVPRSKKNIFRTTEMQKLLDAAKTIDAGLVKKNKQSTFLPLVMLCGLAGLRTSEFTRLKWTDVDFDNGRLIVGEDENGQTTGKTNGSWRSIKLADNLKAGLQQFKDCKGFIWTNRADSFDKTFQRVCIGQRQIATAAGLKWKQNAPRHSYISYRLILEHPIEDVARDAGNSPDIIHDSYKSLKFDDGRFITEKDGQQWFGLIVPTVK